MAAALAWPLAALPLSASARGMAEGPEPTAAEAGDETGAPPSVDTPEAPGWLRVQVLLDRAHFSPGEIDGVHGSNTVQAIAGYQRHRDLEPTGTLDPATWRALTDGAVAATVEHTLTDGDVAGPFVDIPEDMAEKAELDALGYETPLEALGERFHASPALLKALNPGARFAAGESIRVPNVHAGSEALPQADKVVVDKSDAVIMLMDAQGVVFAQYPATMGSEHDPLPIGEWTINGVAQDPVFHYNPDLFWDADPGDEKARLAPGPNNPVGVVWVDLSKPHYGIHGTPEPATIGKTASHGCIRLTNWSARALSKAVAPGTVAILRE